MRIPRLYCPELAQGNIEIPAQEAHHAGDVLRLRPGDRVVLFDGCGREASATISSLSRGHMSVDVGSIDVREFELPIRLSLAVALPRTQRQGFLIEKCTELGVAEIWPIMAERAVARPSKGSVEKLSRRAIEASKQAQRCYIPKVHTAVEIGELVQRQSDFDGALVCHNDAHCAGIMPILASFRRDARVIAFVGPEGGWSESELITFGRHGFRKILLGPNVLRVETAAIAVCAAISLYGTTTTPIA